MVVAESGAPVRISCVELHVQNQYNDVKTENEVLAVVMSDTVFHAVSNVLDVKVNYK